LQGAEDVRIEKALDDNGQLLEQVTTPALTNAEAEVRWLIDANATRAEVNCQAPVRLRLGDRPAKSLRELRGTATVRVLTPPETLLTIDDVFQAGGRTFKGSDGAAIKLLEAGRLANGQYRVRLAVDGLPRALVLRAAGPGILRVNGAARLLAGQVAGGGPAAATWSLQNAAGREFRYLGFETTLMANAGGVGQELRLTFEPDANLGNPVKLVQKGRRPVLLDVPFTLENVPLP
jgi:hypothetical protein